MTADELAPIIGAMTEQPWRVDDDTPCAYSGDVEVMVAGDEANNYDGDMPAVVALANHADAFLELVRACERLAAGDLMGRDHDPGCRCCDCELRSALAAVHAVGKEGE